MNWLTIAGIGVLGFTVGFAIGATHNPTLLTVGMAVGIGCTAGGITGAWSYLMELNHGRGFRNSNLA